MTKTKRKRTDGVDETSAVPPKESDSGGSAPESQDSSKRSKTISTSIGPPTDIGDPTVQALARAPSHLQRNTAILCRNGAFVALDQADTEDSFVQALRYILTNPIFSDLLDLLDLLDAVDANAAKAQDVQAIFDAEMRGNPSNERRNELTAIAQGLKTGAKIVVTDATGYHGSWASHRPDENMILVGDIQDPLKGWDKYTGDYWPCLEAMLFELCNAARANVSRSIIREAGEGTLGCASFVLSAELNEDRSGVAFDWLWSKIMAAGPHEVNKGGEIIKSDVPGLRFVKWDVMMDNPFYAQKHRWTTNLYGGHVAEYARMWFSNFCQKFMQINKENPGIVNSFVALVAPSKREIPEEGSSARDKKQIIADVKRLTGYEPPPYQIVDVVAVMRAARSAIAGQ
ncbi:hypothetical protein [Nonomuraea sp. NPDC049141]|uniref:hypothetical protein n=1 Tax=Nonomuraea sp. NPDC049141 TaxID=3155500 RepID=UPI0033DD89D2